MIWMGWSLQVQQGWIAEFVTNRACGRAGGTECIRASAVSTNLASCDYSLVKKSIAAFTIIQGRYKEPPEAH